MHSNAYECGPTIPTFAYVKAVMSTIEDLLDCLDCDALDLELFRRLFNPSNHAHAKDRQGVSLLRRVIWTASEWCSINEAVPNVGPRVDVEPLVDVCRQLLEHGADPNEVDVYAGDSLLTEFFSWDVMCPGVADTLLRFGADAEHENIFGETSLLLLLRNMAGRVRSTVCDHLFEYDEYNEHVYGRMYPPCYERMYLQMARSLLAAGANPNRRGSPPGPEPRGTMLPLDLHTHLTDTMRELLRAYGARTRDEHDADWALKRTLSRPYPWDLPKELCEHILAYAFHSDRFYDDLGCIERVAWAEQRSILTANI